MNTTTHYLLTAAAALVLAAGCASEEKKDRDFYTSGSREADQRAEQRIAKEQQLRGEGADMGQKKPLYDRIGGEKGVAAIVDDFTSRVLNDPRVNWEREGITRGGVLGIGDKPIAWKPTAENVARLKKHMAQFITLATGGPVKYEGREMKHVHAGMQITNAEFDSAIGDLKATLDTLNIGTEEQKELLAIMESTRPQVAEER